MPSLAFIRRLLPRFIFWERVERLDDLSFGSLRHVVKSSMRLVSHFRTKEPTRAGGQRVSYLDDRRNELNQEARNGE